MPRNASEVETFPLLLKSKDVKPAMWDGKETEVRLYQLDEERWRVAVQTSSDSIYQGWGVKDEYSLETARALYDSVKDGFFFSSTFRISEYSTSPIANPI